MRVGIAADHGGFELKSDTIVKLTAAGYTVIDFGADTNDPADDYPDFVIPLADAVDTGWADRGIALFSHAAGASICANKILGARAAPISARMGVRQIVEEDHMNILCIDCPITSAAVVWDLTRTFLETRYSQEHRHLRRLEKVAYLEEWRNAPHSRSFGRQV